MAHKIQIMNNFGMDTPAIYRLRVRGEITPDFGERLDGVNITSRPGPSGDPESILVGRLVDQAALSGLLNSLYDLHLPLLSVDCLEVED